MINVKKFSYRQAFDRYVIYLFFFTILVFVLLLNSLLVLFSKDDFMKVMAFENNYSRKIFSRSQFIRKIIHNEMSIYTLYYDEKLNNNAKQNDIIMNDNNITTEFANKITNEANTETNNKTNNKTNNETNKVTEATVVDNNTVIEIQPLESYEYKIPDKYDTYIWESGKIQVGNTYINNYSKLKLNLNELSKPAKIKCNGFSDFLIFHTHATESYSINSDEVKNYRSINENYNMISIGKVLEDELKIRGFNALHDTAFHDYPSYNGAYKHSLEVVQKYFKSKDFDFVFDVHRDAISSDLTYGPTCEINGEKVAKLMFVIGTNASGANHDEWMKNFKNAIAIQNRANEMYPGLFRDLHLSKSRYNQHVSECAFIIEVGTTRKYY